MSFDHFDTDSSHFAHTDMSDHSIFTNDDHTADQHDVAWNFHANGDVSNHVDVNEHGVSDTFHTDGYVHGDVDGHTFTGEGGLTATGGYDHDGGHVDDSAHGSVDVHDSTPASVDTHVDTTTGTSGGGI